MTQIRVPYTQSLWKIEPPSTPTSASQQTQVKAGGPQTRKKSKRPDPPKLSQQIHIRNDGVNDLSPSQYWTKDATVTLLVGDLHRDRYGDKSCVLYLPHPGP